MRIAPIIAARRRSEQAFTMVEIAISLAVVAFALVAILGVLPTGLQVQRDNREETLINADGAYILEALRTGQDRLGLLSNSVYYVRINYKNGNYSELRNDPPGVPGQTLLGMLGTPVSTTDIGVSNVVAWMRALNSSAMDLDPDARDLSFRYEAVFEIHPVQAYPPGLTNSLSTNQLAQLRAVQTNLHDVRLTVRWPLYRDSVNAPNNARVGARRQTFREMFSGTHYYYQSNNIGGSDRLLFYFDPSAYTLGSAN